MTVRYAGFVLAILLLVATAGAAATAEDVVGDMGHGGMMERGDMHGDMHRGMRGEMHDMGRGAMAPAAECDKQCVTDLQRQLHVRGMYMGKMDGIAGPQTRQAIMDFQSQQGMEATGLIDEEILSALNVQPSGRGGPEVEQPGRPGMGDSM